MDGTSPGPGVLDVAAVTAGWQTAAGAGALPQACVIDWSRQAPYQPPGWTPSPTFGPIASVPVPVPGGTVFRLRPPGDRELSDADVERIARRVVELLKAAP